MLLSENFLDIVITNYNASQKFGGKMLTYNSKTGTFEAIHRKWIQDGLKLRSILFGLITVAMGIRILDLKLKATEGKASASVETNLSIMMLLIFLLITERYRHRSKFPNYFVNFLNGAIKMEKFYGRGIN